MDSLDYAIKEGKSIDLPMLNALWQQYCSPLDDTAIQIQSSLAFELVSLQSAVTDQKEAGTVFAVSINDVAQTIDQEAPTKEQLAGCVTDLSAATNKMREQLDTLMKRLETSDSHVASLERELAESQRAMMKDPNQATDIRPTDGLTVERIVSAAPHVLKAAIPKVFEVTGVVPNLLKAPPPWIFSCPVEPNRFLTPQESKRTTAVSVAVRRAIEKLNGTLADCETAYCDMPLQPVLLVMQTKDKFLCEFRYKASL